MDIFGLNKNSTVHFIGIGGISMSSLAQILINEGYKVTGSDIKSSHITKKISDLGAEITIGHNKNNIKNPDLVVYTAAINKNNPEYIEAINKCEKVVERSTFLGELMKNYKNCCCISGTHGKTTTTSMCALVTMESKCDPTVLIGGELKEIGGNIRIGSNETFITEACEYVDSFLEFFPTKAIITNIDEDHLDYFKDINHIISSFNKFANLLPENGTLIVTGEDENVTKATENVKCNILTYGLTSEYDCYPQDMTLLDNGCYEYTLCFKNKIFGRIRLNVPGKHNVLNSLSTAALAFDNGYSFETIKSGLENFFGTARRFEIKGEYNGALIVDDYAHHPTEIKATLDVCKKMKYKKVIAVFQPHTYSRTKALLKEFSESFYNTDRVIITDIYAAREKDDGSISAETLSKLLVKNNVKAVYIKNFEDIEEYLRNTLDEDKLVITIGAGDVYKIGENLLK